MRFLNWLNSLVQKDEREALRIDIEAALHAKIQSELQLKHAEEELRLTKATSQKVVEINVRNHFTETINGLITGKPRDV